MRTGTTIGCCLAILLFGAPSARAANNIECMDQAYAVNDQQVIDDYIAQHPLSKVSPSHEGLAKTLGNRARMCASTNQWTPSAVYLALLHASTKVQLSRTKKHLPFSPDNTTRLLVAIDTIDLNLLRLAFGAMIEAQIDGKPVPEMSEHALLQIQDQVLKAGVKYDNDAAKADEQAEFIGRLAAARLMLRIISDKFAKA